MFTSNRLQVKKTWPGLLFLLLLLMPWAPQAQDSCEINTLPYFNDFEDEPGGSYANAFPRCWTRINNAISYNYFPYIASGNVNIIHGNRSLFWKPSPSPYYANNAYAILPAVNQVYDSLSHFTLSFYAKNIDTAAPFPILIVGVMVSNANDDTNSFVPVDTITVTPAVTLYTVNFASYSGNGKYITICCPRTSVERRVSIDDLYLNLTSQWCNPVSNLRASSTDSEVTLRWNANPVSGSTSSFTVILGTDTVTGVTDTFYTFHNLHDSTTYDYAVAAECPNGISTYLLGSIQTECHPLTYDDLPYTEDFEPYEYGRDAAISPCWHKGMSSQNYSGLPYPSRCYIDNDTVGLDFGSSTTYSSWAALPRLDDSVDVSRLEVEFLVQRHYRPTDLTQVVVGVATHIFTDSTNNLQFNGFVAVDTIDLSDEPIYSLHPTSVRFENYTPPSGGVGGGYILFLAPAVPDSMSEYVYNIFSLDNVTLKVANPCHTPQHVRVTRVTAESVYATWSSESAIDSFIVFIGTPGTDISTFTPHYVHGNSVTIDSLNPDTEYELVVVAQCGQSLGSSDPSYPVRFHTLCAPIATLPFTEDFEGLSAYVYPQVSTNILPHCWMYWNVGTESSYRGFPVVYADAAGGHSGSNALRFHIGDTSDQIAIMPLTTDIYPLTDLQVSFWLKPADITNFELTVGVMSDPTDTASFVPVRTIQATSANYHGWMQYVVGFANYHGPHGHVAFKAPWSTPRGNRFYLDEITIDELSSNCATITAIHAETTASAARLTWDYNIEFGIPMGFNVSYHLVPGSTFAPDDTVTTNLFTTEPELLLTGLGVDSTYWVSVVSDCGDLNGIADTLVFSTQEIPCIRWDTADIAGDTLVLGNPGTETNALFPVGATAPFTYVQHLFLASEIPVSDPTTLKGIGFDYAYTQPAPHATNCDIYLSHTTSTDLSNAFATGQQQLVYSGSLGITGQGWNYILFNQGLFEYDGVSNLCVTIVKNNNVMPGSNYTFRHETTTDFEMTRWGYRLAPNGAVNGSPVGTHYRSNTRLITSGNVYCGQWASCLPPVVRVDTLDERTYRLSWIPGYHEESWDVDYRQVSGSTINTGDSGWTSFLVATTLTECIIPVDDLQADTRYEFRVTANCGDTNVSASAFVVTPCDYISIPFSYDFEGLPAGNSSSTPADIHCWHHLSDGGYGYNGMPYVCSVGHSGNRSLRWGFSTAGNYGTYQAIVLPPVDGSIDPIHSLYLSFWAKLGEYCQAPLFQVGVMTDPNDINTFWPVDTISIDSTSTNWDLYEASLESYAGIGLYIAIRFDRPGEGNWGAFLDDIRLSTEPICRRVRDIKVRNVTTDSATISWTRGNSETEWEITIQDSQNDHTLRTYTEVCPYNVHELQGNTAYTVSVRAICSPGDTSVACTASFRTPCYLLDNLPYTNDFENEPFYSSEVGVGVTRPNAVPVCWLRLPSTQYSPYVGSSNNIIHGNNSLCWEIDYVNGPESEYAVLPPVDLGVYDIHDLYLSFYAKTTANAAPYPSFVVGVMGNSTDTASFIPVDTVVPDNNITLYTVSFASYAPPSGGVGGGYIAIRCPRNTRDRSAILDDIFLTDRLCYPPSNLRSSSTDTTVTVWWNPVSGSTSNQGSSFTVMLGTDTVTGVIDTFYTFHGLTDSTAYHYAVATECAGINSIPLTGTTQTECRTLTYADLPYREDFESYYTGYHASDISPCWHKGEVRDNGIHTRLPNPSLCRIDNDTVALYFSAGQYMSSWAALPRIDDSVDISALEVNFLMMRPNSVPCTTQLVVGFASEFFTDSANHLHFLGFTPVDTIDLSDQPASSIHDITVRFDRYTGTGRYLLFHAPSPAGGDNNFIGNGFQLDNVTLRIANPCPTPQNVRVTHVTHDSVTVTWDPIPAADTLLIHVMGVHGGTPLHIFTSSHTNTCTIGGLTPDTEYELQVVAGCSDPVSGSTSNMSEPSFHIFFHTHCAPLVTLPFVEDFESVTGYPYPSSNVNNLPPCWLYLNRGSSYGRWGFPLVHADSTFAHSGINAMRFGTPNQYDSYLDQTAIMPLTDSLLYPVSGLQVSFWARSSDLNNNDIIVGVMPDPTDTNSFIPVDTVFISTWGIWYSHHTVSFAGYRGPHGHVAFRTEGPDRPYIDDIVLDKRPCSPIEDLHLVYTTTDSIVIAWTDTVDALGAWILEYDTVDFTPGTGGVTPIHIIDTPISTFNFQLSIPSLSPNTTYYIYLYPDCLDSVTYHSLVATTLEPPPTCIPPSNISGTLLPNGLSLTWTPGGTENKWELTLGSTTVIATAPAYTFTQLVPSNAYTVHIRSICDQEPGAALGGDTSLPVTVTIAVPRYRVTVTADNPAHGSATGSGIYYYGDIATLTASAYPGYIFTMWSDSNTANPRNLLVTSDTSLTARFREADDTVGIDELSTLNFQLSIYPNPADNVITLSLMGISGRVSIAVHDMKGREVRQQVVTIPDTWNRYLGYQVPFSLDGLAPGPYLLHVTSETCAPLVKKLIVK